MELIESILEIKKAMRNNRLVIFVGAGISKNSGVPTWGELIKQFALRVGYDKCKSCDRSEPECPKDDCLYRFQFSQDEYLRIPEYFYQSDDSPNHEAYYSLIHDTLNSDAKPNPIHQEIFRAMPHHIITTNYDTLLEDTPSVNVSFYPVVFQDKDILSNASDRYIMKMHGDINNLEGIVLKETDYLDYERNYTLISTYIKSLFIDHTFLFIGYSLNDYNLRLILGWINYFSKQHEVETRPKNFLLQLEEPLALEVKRLEKGHVQVVDLSGYNEDLGAGAQFPPSLNHIYGKKLFAYLSLLSNTTLLNNMISLRDILRERYKILAYYPRISIWDLLAVHPLGRTEYLGAELHFVEEKWFDDVEKLLASEEEDDRIIRETFQKAGITEISYIEFRKNKSRKIPLYDHPDDLFIDLYVQNNYIQLEQELEQCTNLSIGICYRYLLDPKISNMLNGMIADEASQVIKSDYITILLHKMRSRLATITWSDRQETRTTELREMFKYIPVEFEKAAGFLKDFFNSSASNLQKMDELIIKQEERNAFRSHTFYSGHAHEIIWKLKAYAYDYYFFFLQNSLPLFYFTEPKTYFSYYLRAILCSYSPIDQSERTNSLGLETHHQKYPIGYIEIDMFVKYVEAKKLNQWLKDYSVQALILHDGVDIVSSFKMFCKSFSAYNVRWWSNQLICFAVLLSKVKLEDEEKKTIFEETVNMFRRLSNDNQDRFVDAFEALHTISLFTLKEGTDSDKEALLETLLLPSLSQKIRERADGRYTSIISSLAPSVSSSMVQSLKSRIDSEEPVWAKCRLLYTYRKLLPIDKYKNFLQQNINSIPTDILLHFTLEKYVVFDESVSDVLLNRLSEEDRKRKATPGVRSMPDPIEGIIQTCLLLILFEYPIDITKLKPYEEYSKHLSFVLDPESFDYSKVNTSDYMWQNFIRDNNYQQLFISHKDEILSEDLEKIFQSGHASKDQQKIVYGVLLNDKDTLWKFGE